MNHSASSTRDRVLELIKKEGNISVKSLTEAIGITPMAIRGHLAKLEKEELIEVSTLRQKLGRPLQVFRLTAKGEAQFPKAYDSFALDLIEDIKNLDNGKTLHKVVQAREERLIHTLQEELAQCPSPADKMAAYCRFIEHQGNMPQCEPQEGNRFLLQVSNCSISNIASRHGFCCESEIRILKQVFPEAKVQRMHNMFKDAAGCSYLFEF